MKITLIGSNGQLGQDLTRELHPKHDLTTLTHQDIEVTNLESVETLTKYNPEVIINTAAFHKTDQCEDQPTKTFQVNALGPKNLTAITQQIGAATIYISTDYVFSGTKKEPYNEEDTPDPINTYGISKLAGELYTKQNPKHYILRVASLFGAAGSSGKGGNFIETMLKKAKNNEQINVIDDIWMSPTYTKDAATLLQEILTQKLPYGTYHITNQGKCTWYQFAQEIFTQTQITANLNPVTHTQFKTKAKRPLNSALTSTKLPKYNLTPQNWKQALTTYLKEKNYLP